MFSDGRQVDAEPAANISDALRGIPLLIVPAVFTVVDDIERWFGPRAQRLLTGRHGQILGFSEKEGWSGWDDVVALVPEAELHDFLKSVDRVLVAEEVRQHEEHVRSVVLLGGSLMDIPVFERWALNAQRALDRILEECKADADCDAAYPNIQKEFKNLWARAAEQPVTTTFSDKSLGSATLTDSVRSAFVAGMDDATRAAAIIAGIRRVRRRGGAATTTLGREACASEDSAKPRSRADWKRLPGSFSRQWVTMLRSCL